MNDIELIKLAEEARKKAYTPYSNFKVGAALVTESGKVFKGCNIESASYSVTICAERTAIVKCVSEGNLDIKKIAIVGSEDKLSFPCGVCRQLLFEFGRNIEIIVAKNTKEFESYTIEELLPHGFGPENLRRNNV